MSAAWDWINEYRSGASFLWLGGVDRVSLNDFPVLWCEDLSFTREELGDSPIRFWLAGPGFLDWHQQFYPCEVPTPTPVAPEPEINIIPYEGLIAPVPKTPQDPSGSSPSRWSSISGTACRRTRSTPSGYVRCSRSASSGRGLHGSRGT